jgi:hypothetical protein
MGVGYQQRMVGCIHCGPYNSSGTNFRDLSIYDDIERLSCCVIHHRHSIESRDRGGTGNVRGCSMTTTTA